MPGCRKRSRRPPPEVEALVQNLERVLTEIQDLEAALRPRCTGEGIGALTDEARWASFDLIRPYQDFLHAAVGRLLAPLSN